MALHPLTHVCGAVIILALLALIALTINAYRVLQTHRAAEAAAFQSRGASAFSIVALGLTLPTLLRVMALACAISGVCYAVIGVIAAWLVVEERDAGLRYVSPLADPANLSSFSSAGQLCIALAKLTPSGYCFLKTFSYLFFFLKSRTVRPTEKLSWVHKGVLLLTVSLFGFGVIAIWLVNGDRNTLDGVCTFDVPLWQCYLMGAADLVFSAIYLALFVHPLWETIRANRAFKMRTANTASVQVARVKVAPIDSALPPPPPSVSESASTNARGSALETVMRRNMYSCMVGIASTIVCLGLVIIAHLTDQPNLRKAGWMLGAIDSTVANVCIAHLMHKKDPATARNTGRDETKAGAAGNKVAHAPAPQLPSPKHTAPVHLTERTQSLELRSPASRVQQIGSTPRVSVGTSTVLAPAAAHPPTAPTHNSFMLPSDALNAQVEMVQTAGCERDSS